MELRNRQGEAATTEGHPFQDQTYDESLPQDGYDSDADDDLPTTDAPKTKSHRPPNNAFTQQRLRALNPVMTARTVIPVLVLIAIVFVPLGAAMWYASHVVQDLQIDYTQCQYLASRDHWSEIPGNYTFNFKNNASFAPPQWKLDIDPEWEDDDKEKYVCRIQFEVPVDMEPPVLFFYRLVRFHANHRRYVKSFSEDQIKGDAPGLNLIRDQVGQNCQPLVENDDGKFYYPCGLIANSLFNDTFSNNLKGVNGTTKDYEMTNKGIAWSSDKNRFKKTTYKASQIAPPPNWVKKYPDGYTDDNIPDISTWEEFQNWMAPAALPAFNKLALRNANKMETLESGTYEVSVGMHWPVVMFDGSKYIYLSTRSAIGGKNIFLGVSWMVGGGLCFLLALALLLVNFIKPRKPGDPSMLSWNRQEMHEKEQ
ncbi:phospholipid-transporting ATPase accessory subunit Lem3p [Diutina catenulata]